MSWTILRLHGTSQQYEAGPRQCVGLHGGLLSRYFTEAECNEPGGSTNECIDLLDIVNYSH